MWKNPDLIVYERYVAPLVLFAPMT